MKRLLAALLVLTAATAIARADEPAKKIRVLLTYGGHGFEEKPFFAMFDALKDITYTKAEMPKQADLLKPGLQKDYDVIVMYDMSNFSPAQEKALAELLTQGIGLVSLHHNLGAHRDWPEWRKIIGGTYIFKPEEIAGKPYKPSTWAHGQEMKIAVADKNHPITKGLTDFQIHDETYKGYFVDPGVKVLLTTDNPKNEPQIAWVTQFGKSRVFFLMLGHDHLAWENPAYPQLLDRGIHWAAGK